MLGATYARNVGNKCKVYLRDRVPLFLASSLTGEIDDKSLSNMSILFCSIDSHTF